MRYAPAESMLLYMVTVMGPYGKNGSMPLKVSATPKPRAIRFRTARPNASGRKSSSRRAGSQKYRGKKKHVAAQSHDGNQKRLKRQEEHQREASP